MIDLFQIAFLNHTCPRIIKTSRIYAKDLLFNVSLIAIWKIRVWVEVNLTITLC